MSKIAREIEDALKAVSIARLFFHAEAGATQALDLQLWKLLKRGSAILRAEMAEQLAHAPDGPRITLRGLACDDNPDVALPVLRHSAAISAAALAEMARCKGEDHLNAIAARSHLDMRVATILARRGGFRVLKTLLRNRTARLEGRLLKRLRQQLRHQRATGARKSPSRSSDPASICLR